MSEFDFEPGQRVFGVRNTADVRREEATVTRVTDTGVTVEFADGHRVSTALIDGYVTPIPEDWTPGTDPIHRMTDNMYATRNDRDGAYDRTGQPRQDGGSK